MWITYGERHVWGMEYLIMLAWCEVNKFPPVFRGMASYFPRFSSSSRQNVVESRGLPQKKSFL